MKMNKKKGGRLKRAISELSLSRIAFISHDVSGIFWLLTAVLIFGDGNVIDVIRTVCIIVAVFCNAFQLAMVFPKDKEDEMANKNFTKAEADALNGIKIAILVILLAILILIIIFAKNKIKTVSSIFLFESGIALLIGMLGLINLLVGCRFRKYEKE